MAEWDGYILDDFAIDFPAGSIILDIGCGEGLQMREAASNGSRVIGVDVDDTSLALCRDDDLEVMNAAAEFLPFADEIFEGIICKVVLPYTAEEKVISEIGRLLKPHGKCYLISHGAGYYLRYVLRGESFKIRIYGLRSLANTWFRSITGGCLPGFLGDTIYQSRRRLSSYFVLSALSVERAYPAKSFLGFPVFIYQTLQKNY